jgi:hypothetical protein
MSEPKAQSAVVSSALLAAADPFIRIVAMSDGLPPHLKTDDCPLARHIPGQLRKLVSEIQKAANAPHELPPTKTP